MYEKLKKNINLENYFLLVIFLLPVYLWRFTILGVPENLWEILAMLAIILAIWKIGKNITFSRYEKKIVILFLVIIMGLAAGIIKSGNYRIGLGIIKSWFIIPFLFSFFAGKIIKDKNKAYLSLFFSESGVAILALIYQLLGLVTFDGRLEAIYNSPNYLAMFLSPGIIIGMVMGQNRELKFQNKFYILLLPIVLALFFTYSYAAWVSVILAIIIIFTVSNNFSRKYFYILGLMFLSLIFILRDTTKFQDLINYSSRSSLASRAMIWQSAEKILSDNYILGIGPGNFQEKYLGYQGYFSPYLEWAVPHSHNLALAFWLYSGIFGLLAFGVILYLFLKKNVSESVSISVRYISLGIVIYFLFHGLADTTYFKNDLSAVFWLAVLL